jgi:hypothetical protein
MRRIITAASIALSLLGGGVAMADNHFDRGGEQRELHRDRDDRPSPRYERHEERRGYRWIGGEWRRSGRQWRWSPGHYVRARR